MTVIVMFEYEVQLTACFVCRRASSLARLNEARRVMKISYLKFVQVDAEVTKDCCNSSDPSSGKEDSSMSSSSRKLTWRTIDENKMNFGIITNSNGMIFNRCVSAERREMSEFASVDLCFSQSQQLKSAVYDLEQSNQD